MPAPATATEVETKPMISVVTQPVIGVQPQIKPLPQIQPKPKIKPQPESKPKTELKTPVRTVTKIATKTKTGTIISIKTPKEKLEQLTDYQRNGIIAWKQGWIYKMRYPPYGQSDIINSRKPLGGVQYYKDIGSAQKSVVLEKGDIPKDLTWDMGAIDVGVGKTKEGTKPVLKYVKDLQYSGKGSGKSSNNRVKTYKSNGRKHVKAQSLSRVK
jgi:hypothetical protein